MAYRLADDPVVNTRIGTRIERVGWHSWQDAAGRRTYLRALHRHSFVLTVEIDVHHDDRDVEFHDLRDFVCDWWGDETNQQDRGSCEQIATRLWSQIDTHFPGRAPTVQVDEDGEAWAKVEGNR